MENQTIFVIDTNKYAGNFEREMCAHITGQIGECEVGREFVEDLSIKFDNVKQVADDSHCYRPASIYEDENGVYNSVAIYFDSEPTQEQIDFMKERAKNFGQARLGKDKWYKVDDIEILGFRLVIEEVTTTSKDV